MASNRPAQGRPRGGLELCVLAVLRKNELHGYALAQRLAAAGVGVVQGGTLYPLLARLERDRMVDVRWEPGRPGRPGRKYYALTDLGRERLAADAADWRAWAAAVHALLPGETSCSDERP